MMIDYNLALGIIGMTMILIGFLMEEFAKHTRHESLAYNAINIVGSLFLIVYASALRSWPFLILNTAWLFVASYKLVQILRK